MIDHILMARNTTLNLGAIPHPQDRFGGLEGGLLGSFCKLLGVTVSHLDIVENKSSPINKTFRKSILLHS